MAKKIKEKDMLRITQDMVGEEVEVLEEDFEDSKPVQFNQPVQLDGGNRVLWTAVGEGCNKYDPCPICFKCRVKGSHLFDKCDTCEIPICVHTNKQRELMIRRVNFTQEVGKDLIDSLKQLEQQVYSPNQAE